jgi:hypothetical protein
MLTVRSDETESIFVVFSPNDKDVLEGLFKHLYVETSKSCICQDEQSHSAKPSSGGTGCMGPGTSLQSQILNTSSFMYLPICTYTETIMYCSEGVLYGFV